jgi:hypothetical protein
MRGLIRRIQNRGRNAGSHRRSHRFVDRGDESNAVIEALDAVNLMTVRLQRTRIFIVFVVSLARAPAVPTSGSHRRRRGGGAVVRRSFVSRPTRWSAARETGNTRLLYVLRRASTGSPTVLRVERRRPGARSRAWPKCQARKQLSAAATAFEEYDVVD